MSDVDEEVQDATQQLVPYVLHHLAYHASEPTTMALASRLGDLIGGDRNRIEYVSWTTGRVMRHAGGPNVNVIAARETYEGHRVETSIDDVEPVRRACVRYLRSAVADDRDTALAVYATVPDDELGFFLRGVLLAAVPLIRGVRWGAHQ